MPGRPVTAKRIDECANGVLSRFQTAAAQQMRKGFSLSVYGGATI